MKQIEDQKDQKRLFKALWKYIFAATVSALVFSVAGRVFLREFYRLISFEPQFSDIFRQINTAEMRSPVFLLWIASAGCLFLLAKLWRKNTFVKVLAIVLAVIVTLVMMFVSIWFTRVNEVMFGDVVISLIPLLESGAI